MPPITPLVLLFVSCATLWLFGWQWAVILRRRALQISLGDGDDRRLRRLIRVHANAVENLVPFSVLVVAADLAAAPSWLTFPSMALMLVGRAMHPVGILEPKRFMRWRVVGMALSLTATLALGLGALAAALAAWL